MKLSLTAIAALSAAFFHPTVATGTRAASSNGNTNAAEAKPDRDLMGSTAFQVFDKMSNFGFVEEINEAGVIVQALAARAIAGRIVNEFGGTVGNEDVLPVGIVQTTLGLDASKGGVPDDLDDNGDGYVSAEELAQGLVLMDPTKLNALDEILFRELVA